RAGGRFAAAHDQTDRPRKTQQLRALSPARSLLRHPPFVLYFSSRAGSEFAYTISAVFIGWQIYALTNSAFALGLAGLVQFVPSAVLVFAAGHAADRFDRKRVVQVCQAVEGCTAAALAVASYTHHLAVWEIFVAVLLLGVAGAYESPSSAALLPGVTTDAELPRGAALSSGAFQAASIGGPALGGLAYAIAPWVPCAIMAVVWVLASLLNAWIRVDRAPAPQERPSFREAFAGVAFVRNDPAILGTISLDLFAVLFGGTTALLPIYARDILHTGPWVLGALRAAPGVGALTMTVVLARYTIRRHVGVRMLGAVAIFGAAVIVFAFSRSIALSLVALALMGAADTVSVVIRASLVQLSTPDEMRGRVGAINYLFINASNQLGEFESGTAAALLGPVAAAGLGGLACIVIAVAWLGLFPALRSVDRLGEK
ncbi:MAG TPA: MFS transporter, partial [Candidatus Tumulicola sp.]